MLILILDVDRVIGDAVLTITVRLGHFHTNCLVLLG